MTAGHPFSGLRWKSARLEPFRTPLTAFPMSLEWFPKYRELLVALLYDRVLRIAYELSISV
jgi:hypothetical protein